MSLDTSIPAPLAGVVFFDRRELDRLLRLYGRMVAAGEWRDQQAVDAESDLLGLSPAPDVERRAHRIEKRPGLARRQGAWAVIGQGGLVLKRGRDLEQVLALLDRGRFRVVE